MSQEQEIHSEIISQENENFHNVPNIDNNDGKF